MSVTVSKNIKTHIQNKYDIEINWFKAETFVSLSSELIY